MADPAARPAAHPAAHPTAHPGLGGVVVHWHDEARLRSLIAAWPHDERFPLVVVDNSRDLGPGSLPPPVIQVDPGHNLGFGGGIDRGVTALLESSPDCPWALILNPDVVPEEGAVERLALDCQRLRGIDPKTVGVAPALLNDDGTTQHRWQLQPLPTARTLLAQVFFLAGERGPREPPAHGALVEQPAAAALALHLETLRPVMLRPAAVGGQGRLFDPRFFPAWFEDVDLARRIANRGLRLRYAPAARFRHARGSSVPALGYGRFLWVYYRNLTRYLRAHHGAFWAAAARLLLPVSMLARLLLLPLRTPRRALSRLDAARGLLAVAAGALSGWRWPAAWAAQFDGDKARGHGGPGGGHGPGDRDD